MNTGDNKLLDYFNGDELAASTWQNKYALRDNDGNIIEETPDDMHHRLAKEFARIEEQFDCERIRWESEYGKNRARLTEERIYELFKDFKKVIPGGSVLSGAGSGKPVSLSNCFVCASPRDDYGDIMMTRAYQAQLMSRRGGVGYDMSNLRPRGAKVNNAAVTSTGAASFMDVNSAITNEVAQQGRRGALMLTISINHPDVMEFIEKKQDLTKVTGANVSVKVTDEFMQAVEEKAQFTLRWPVDANINWALTNKLNEGIDYEYNKLYPMVYSKNAFDSHAFGGYMKIIKAKELWDNIIHCAWNTAEPGIIFDDRMHDYAPDGVYEDFKMISTNPCQPSFALVMTPRGLNTIGQIRVGDTIWTSEGWAMVFNKVSSGVQKVYRYRTDGGVFVGTENHKVISKGKKVEAKDAKSIDSLSGPFVVAKELDWDYVAAGYAMGCGEKIDNTTTHVKITAKNKEVAKGEIGKRFEKIKGSMYKYIGPTLPLDWNINEKIPSVYLAMPRLQIMSILCGLFSANASIVGNNIVYRTESVTLRSQLQLLLSYLGIDSISKKDKNNVYSVNITYDKKKYLDAIGFVQTYKREKVDTKAKTRRIVTRNLVEQDYLGEYEVFDITVNNASHTYWTSGVNVANCGEIGMGKNDSCRLIHVNLSSFVKNPFTDKAIIDYKGLYETFYETTRLADDLVELEIEAVNHIYELVERNGNHVGMKIWKEILETGKKGRRAGIGFLGLSDMVAMLNVKFASDESLDIIDKVCHVMFDAELDAEIDLALERGPFPSYDRTLEHATSNDWYKFVSEEFPEKFERMDRYGRRNLSFSTIAPTGSVSMLAQTSSGIEPVFMPFYMRRRKCVTDTDRVDFVDKLGVKFTEFVVVHPTFKKWAESKHGDTSEWKLDDWQKAFEESPWFGATAQEIPWKNRVKLQGICQKYITHSISSTCNLSKDITEQEVSGIYFESWKCGTKGTTIYRDGCREGILNAISSKKEDERFLSNIHAPKRPKTLDADFYSIKAYGELYYVIVGLYMDKPYETFAFKPEDQENRISNHKGKITKRSKGHYKYESDELTIDDLTSMLNDEEKACTLLTSTLLRHGIPLKFIIKTEKKINENIISFSSAICRILSKYIPKELDAEVCPECGGRLVRESGCLHCIDCGYSKCL